MLFLALRTHFTQAKYDFFQMHGKLRANKESYNKRHDKYFFEKVAKTYNAEDLRDFFVANILNDKHYITELLEDEAERNFTLYKGRRQALAYNFTSELDKVFKKGIKEPFQISNDHYPTIINQYLGGVVSCDTLVIINDFITFSDKFDKYLGQDDVIWSKVALKISKYKPFLKYDKEKFKHILKEKIDETTKR